MSGFGFFVIIQRFFTIRSSAAVIKRHIFMFLRILTRFSTVTCVPRPCSFNFTFSGPVCKRQTKELVTLMAAGISIPTFAAAAETSRKDQAVSASGAAAERTVTFKAFNVVAGQKSISDNNHVMTAKAINMGTVKLEDGKLPDNPKLKTWRVPKMRGREFVGLYTKPVKYAFWGDYTYTGAATVGIPEGFETDCDGAKYDFEDGTELEYEDESSLTTLIHCWQWLSALENGQEDQKVEPGDEVRRYPLCPI